MKTVGEVFDYLHHNGVPRGASGYVLADVRGLTLHFNDTSDEWFISWENLINENLPPSVLLPTSVAKEIDAALNENSGVLAHLSTSVRQLVEELLTEYEAVLKANHVGGVTLCVITDHPATELQLEVSNLGEIEICFPHTGESYHLSDGSLSQVKETLLALHYN